MQSAVIYNPRKKKSGSKKRHSHKRNPSLGVVTNPRRKRRHSKVARRRSGYRSNPGMLSGLVPGGIDFGTIGMNAVGMVATQTLTPMILNALKITVSPTTRIAGKAGTAILGGIVIGKVMGNRKMASAFVTGGLLSVATEVWTTWVAPALGLSGYVANYRPGINGMRGYESARTVIARRQALLPDSMGMTMSPQLAPLY